MKPTTPLDALTAAIDSLPSLWSEPAQILEALGEQGWHLSPDLSLPRSVPKGDPATAAAEIDDVTQRQWCAWNTLCTLGPLTSDELAERYDELLTNRVTPQSAASIRSRLAELERAGHVRRIDERRRTRNGGLARVWVAVYANEAAA